MEPNIEALIISPYADDNPPFDMEPNIKALIVTLEVNTSILVKWFDDNYLKMNADKCHLLICNHSDELSVSIDNEIILGSKEVKLLGVTIDNKLDFGKNVAKLCSKVSLTLARISSFIHEDKLRIIMKAFIESQFGYGPLIWMFHSRMLNK